MIRADKIKIVYNSVTESAGNGRSASDMMS